MATTAHNAGQLPHGPTIWPPATSWPQTMHQGVASLKRLVGDWGVTAETSGPVLLGVSGGADSLALAIIAAEVQRTTGIRFGAIVLDHRLQEITADVARRTHRICQQLGLAPVIHHEVTVEDQGEGIEAAARRARYAAFSQLAQQTGAAGICTAHTANDQAEQVLLALARGSGTRSIGGIRRERTHREPGHEPQRIGRPLLDFTRDQTEAICSWAGVQYFQDPMNFDESIARIRVRQHLLPALADPATGLGAGIFSGLVTSATLAADDADALDELAEQAFEQLAQTHSTQIDFPLAALREQPPAIMRRVLAIAAQHFGAPQPSFERLKAVEELIFPPFGRASSAGPIQLEGHVNVYRQKAGPEYAKLLVIPSYPRAEADTYEE